MTGYIGKTLRITRLTFREAMSHRVVLVGIAVSVLYIVVFALAYNFAQERGTQAITGQRSRVLVGIGMASLTLSGLYVVNLLAGFLALFVAVGAISSDLDAGTLHALLARPIRRSQFVIGRWIAYALLISGYVVVMTSLVLSVAAIFGDYQAPEPLPAIGLMILAAIFLLTLGTLGSTFLPTQTNGALTFTLFGLGWLSGVIEVLGGLQRNEALLNLGATVSIFIPSDALWRSASYFIQSAAVLTASSTLGAALPILANAPPTPFLVLWGLLYPLILLCSATLVFAQRDI